MCQKMEMNTGVGKIALTAVQKEYILMMTIYANGTLGSQYVQNVVIL